MNASTQSKLEYLNETKTVIKEAIVSKGQTILDTDSFRSFADKILAIEGGTNIKITSGTVDVTTEEVITVEHGHGRIPDFCAIFPNAQLYSDYIMPSGKGEAYGNWGFSNAFINKYGYPGMFAGSIQNLSPASNGRWQYMTLIMSLASDWTPGSNFIGAIDDVNTAIIMAGAKIGKCNSATFEYGYAGTYPLQPDTKYTWLAISGLT